MIGLWIGAIALAVAAVLYFVFLPHIDGPSLDQQKADSRQILVRCPTCGEWQAAEPTSSTADDFDKQAELKETNWFRCRQCNHRWSEEREK